MEATRDRIEEETETTVVVACPYCGVQLDGHEPRNNAPKVPEAGIPALCTECGDVAVFEETEGGLGLRMPTPAENKMFEANADLQVTRLIIKMMRELARGAEDESAA